jgi:hypothetical protein
MENSFMPNTSWQTQYPYNSLEYLRHELKAVFNESLPEMPLVIHGQTPLLLDEYSHQAIKTSLEGNVKYFPVFFEDLGTMEAAERNQQLKICVRFFIYYIFFLKKAIERSDFNQDERSELKSSLDKITSAYEKIFAMKNAANQEPWDMREFITAYNEAADERGGYYFTGDQTEAELERIYVRSGHGSIDEFAKLRVLTDQFM